MPMPENIRRLAPGLTLALLVAMAAQFLSDHYGAPVMLMAILLGMPLQFLSEEDRTAPGIAFAARTVLRFGVALLGLRVSLGMLAGLGLTAVVIIVLAVAATILGSVLLSRDKAFGLLTGGSVAICGASAAMAIAAILPERENAERDLAFTVITVTVLSTVAMILYPVICRWLALPDQSAGIFLGGTIHDVAQVVGAGYSVSETTGDISTVVKLMRVTLLAPVVLIGASVLRQSRSGSVRPPLLPGFLVGFLALLIVNSAINLPAFVTDSANALSRAALVMAVAAVGMKTSLAKLRDVGTRPLVMLCAQTAFLAIVVLGAVYLTQSR